MYLLTQTNINVNIRGQFGYTLLHYACININRLPITIFELFITLGADVNVQDNGYSIPFLRAFWKFDPNKGGDIKILHYLLAQKDVKVLGQSRYGDTVLHQVCKRVSMLPLEILRYLIEILGCDVNVQNNEKSTPIHFAFLSFDPHSVGDITILMYLLNQKGINVNIKGYDGNNILHLACKNINTLPLDVFKLLIETHGGDVNVLNNNNDTPLHRALRNFDPRDGGDIAVLTYLINQKNVNVNIKGWNGYTLLHATCLNINYLPLDVFKLLIETKGGDVNAMNDYDKTPIHCALDRFDPKHGGDINVLGYLINQKGVNVNAKYKGDYTLLHTTCIVNLQNTSHSDELNAECDTILCQIVEVIANKCLELVLDDTTS
jgi:ankyrin repeat protein